MKSQQVLVFGSPARKLQDYPAEIRDYIFALALTINEPILIRDDNTVENCKLDEDQQRDVLGVTVSNACTPRRK